MSGSTAGEKSIFFESIIAGEVRTLGPRRVELAAMMAFANEFDRQPFHLDEAAAAASIHGGIIASGIHTLAIITALIVDEYLVDKVMVAGLGIDQLRFVRPVRANDLLSATLHVIETKPHPKRDEMGIVRIAVTTTNQDDQVVMNCIVVYGFARKPRD